MARSRRVRVLLRALAEWVAFGVLWLLFVGTVAWPELLVGAAAAAASTYALRTVEFRRLARLAPRAGFAQIAWLPGYALSGTWQILGVLGRHLLGREPAPSLLYATPYDVNGDDDASATKRALATAYTTMTPSSVVLDVDTSRGLLFIHQLRDSPTAKMTRALGAKA